MLLTQGISVMVAHLWQSTAVAAAVALLSVLLRKNHARTRYWLWLTASMKFLLPFSLFVAAGSYLPKPVGVSPVPQVTASTFVAQTMQQISPIRSHITKVSGASEHGCKFLSVLLLNLWAAGFLVSVCLWWRRWYRVRASVRAALPQPWGLNIPAVLAPTLLEPTTFGIFRPVLVLPQGLVDLLCPEHFQAIIAHELCHVRHRDNLAGAMHMMVESIFWFFPPVWWIGKRLIEERERACDEEVLRLGNTPEVYAESILKVCRFCLESPLSCTCGISGADLKKRVLRIVAPIAPKNLGFAKKSILTATALATVVGPVAFGALTAPENPVRTESEIATSRPSFEVAAIRPNRTGEPLTSEDTPPGRFWARNISVKDLIEKAYELPGNQITEGPGWIDSERYDIEAKMSDSQYRGIEKLNKRQQEHQISLMLQSLLADRFKLAVNHQSKEVKGYALVVARGGPKLHLSGTPGLPPSSHPGSGGGTFFGIVFQLKDSSLDSLASFLSGQLGRPVVNETGLDGNYDETFEVPMDAETDRGSAILIALQDQFGLKLQSKRVSADMIVIAHIERPSGN